MGISQIFTMERMTGTVLIASFISFAIGGTLPIVGEKGNRRMFNLLKLSRHCAQCAYDGPAASAGTRCVTWTGDRCAHAQFRPESDWSTWDGGACRAHRRIERD